MSNFKTQDEVMEELRKIKDEFAAYSGGDVGDLVKMANKIAKQKGFQNSVRNNLKRKSNLTKKTG